MSRRSPFNQRNQTHPSVEESSVAPGATRKSASRAKPVRAAAQTVRPAPTGSRSHASSSSVLPKEARKAKRRAEREEEDQVSRVSDLVLREDPLYPSRRRVWWAMLIIGVLLIMVAFAVMSFNGSSEKANDITTPAGLVALVATVASYALIIGALVWEFVRIRPLRNDAIAKVRGMSARRRQAVVERAVERDDRRRAEKKARRAARRKHESHGGGR